jgi:DNA-binding IclR family transcriptional regulator
MNADPRHPWSGSELAERLGVKPRNLLTQLAEWARHGFLTRTHAGTYALPEPQERNGARALLTLPRSP